MTMYYIDDTRKHTTTSKHEDEVYNNTGLSVSLSVKIFVAPPSPILRCFDYSDMGEYYWAQASTLLTNFNSNSAYSDFG